MNAQADIAQTPPPAPPGYYNQTDIPLPPDPDKTLYNSSFLGVFSRNFVAGFSRALGAVLVYVIFMAIGYFVFSKFLAPQLKPLFDVFEQLGQIQSQQSQINLSPAEIQNVIQQLQN